MLHCTELALFYLGQRCDFVGQGDVSDVCISLTFIPDFLVGSQSVGFLSPATRV